MMRRANSMTESVHIRLYERITREGSARLKAIGMSASQLREHRVRLGRSIDIDHVLAQYERQHGECFWCGEVLSSPEIDHVKPVSTGGTNSSNNIVLACRRCNWEKRAQPAVEFIVGRLDSALPVTSAARARFEDEIRRLRRTR